MICYCRFKVFDLFHIFIEFIVYVVILSNILFMVHKCILSFLSLYFDTNLHSSELQSLCFLLYRIYVAAR
jgi:hypothetical protein